MQNNCDIILLSWNNTELLKKCVESLFKYTDVPCHLIIVDNASNPETQTYLKTLKSTPWVRITVDFNPVNEGFSKGMNRGMKQSQAPYVCLLNNDTEVSPHWLSRILNILDSNPQIGVLNPNSNIFGSPNTSQEIPFLEMGLCIGFCMFIRREVIQKIGYLDSETYDRFFFEDSDYCKRAKKAGYLCALALNSYVHHAEHQSVNRLGTKEEIFRKNQLIFYQKWGKPKRILLPLMKNTKDIDWKELEQKLLPLARQDHAIQIFTSDKAIPLKTHHTQLSVKFISPAFLFPWIILIRLLTKRKKPFDFIFVPQPELNHFLRKTHLLYHAQLITTWEELQKHVT